MGACGKIKSKPKEDKCDIEDFRWFWNTSKDPWDTTKHDHSWAQYDLDISDQIEESYREHLPEHNLSDIKTIKFNYKTNQHLQLDQIDQWKQRPVIRQIPSKIESTLRLDRIGVTEHENTKFYSNNFIAQIQMCYYSNIFSEFQLDGSDPFIRSFTSFTTLLDKKIVSFLLTEFIAYLKDFHKLKLFDFQAVIRLLTNDLKHVKNNQMISYVLHYVRKLTSENFNEIIPKMYIEEGQLYKNLNKTIRSMSLESHMEYIFFFLCFLYVNGNNISQFHEDTTVYRGISLEDDLYRQIAKIYQIDQIIINYDFMSTSRNITIAKNFMKHTTYPRKILFEINVEKESNVNFFLSFKPFDVCKFSLYNEEEIILPPNGVFQVTMFKETKDFTSIQMSFRTNLFIDSLPFIEMDTEMRKQYGIHEDLDVLQEKDYNDIVSFTMKRKNQIKLLWKMTNLIKLDLASHPIKDQGMKTVAAQLIYLTNLKEFDLSQIYFTVEGMKTFSVQLCQLKNLEYLNLNGNQFGAEGMKIFAEELRHLKKLRLLDLGCTNAQDQGIVVLSSQLIHLTNLQQLNLGENSIGIDGIKALAGQLVNLRQLEQLNIEDNNLGEEEMKIFLPEVVKLSQLRQLLLCGNKLQDGAANLILSYLSQLAHIQFLDLSQNEISETYSKTILKNLRSQNPSWKSTAVFIFTRLISVRISKKKELFTQQLPSNSKLCADYGVRLNKQELMCIKNLEYYQNVKWMDLSRNEIEEEIMNNFAPQMVYLSNLKELDLSSNKIGDKEMKTFSAQLQYLTNLRELNLNMNQIGDEGMKAFSKQFLHLHNLRKLTLETNQIGDEGIKAFADNVEHLTNLQHLNMNQNKIGDEGMKTFIKNMKQLVSIKELYFSSNEISDAVQKLFQRDSSILLKLEYYAF